MIQAVVLGGGKVILDSGLPEEWGPEGLFLVKAQDGT